MYEIDLIPLEYHRKKLYSSWLKKAVYSLVLMTVVFVSLFIILRNESLELELNIEELQSQKDITNKHRVQLEKLNSQKNDLNQQLKLLAGLRSGISAEQMFLTIDSALPAENLWITDWNFRRAGTPVEKTDNTVNTGYFIVIPSGTSNNRGKEETWKIETQMSLKGQSIDHSALSEFVLKLTRQQEIEDVKVVSTQLTKINRVKLVNFSLQIIISTLRDNS